MSKTLNQKASNAMRLAVTLHLPGRDLHHVGLPFSQLRDGWLREAGLTIETVSLVHSTNGRGYTMSDNRQIACWKLYHAAHAHTAVLNPHDHDAVHRDALTVTEDAMPTELG
jgi:hypothetical protein